MTKALIEMEEVARTERCVATGCDRAQDRRWRSRIRVDRLPGAGELHVAMPPQERAFVACDGHALPIAQYLLGEMLLSDSLRASSGVVPAAVA